MPGPAEGSLLNQNSSEDGGFLLGIVMCLALGNEWSTTVTLEEQHVPLRAGCRGLHENAPRNRIMYLNIDPQFAALFCGSYEIFMGRSFAGGSTLLVAGSGL